MNGWAVWLVGVWLTCLPLVAASQPARPFYLPEEFEEKPWEEQKAMLPPYPEQRNLIGFDGGPTTDFRFFVDASSVTVDKDQVVRFVLVARSPAGAVNVSFEGLRCKTRERKLYAFGRADRTWAEARRVEWQKLSGTERNPYAAVLAEDFFCPARGIVRTPQEAVDALRRKGHPASATPL